MNSQKPVFFFVSVSMYPDLVFLGVLISSNCDQKRVVTKSSQAVTSSHTPWRSMEIASNPDRHNPS